jgi:hypothetical protein
MRVRRLKLLETEIVEREAGGYEAIVKLRFLEKNYIGIEIFQNDVEQERIDTIAKATLDAIKQALPLPIDMYLRKACYMQPEFLNDLLIVVMVDIYVELKRLELTGCCVCLDKDINFGIARATLDSTNRIVDYLLTKHKLKSLP